MTNWKIENQDVLEWVKTYKGEPAHAMFCDPPYHLTSGNAKYDLPRTGSGNLRESRIAAGGGFMGKAWDGGDIAFRPETWAALAERLHPGAFIFAFASSRGWHRQAVAMEDAGLVMHPSVFMFGFAFGSGFPKATRVKDTSAFDGHRYGLQAMKPALEPCLLFQKPYRHKATDSILETGAGTLNIDGGRIAHDEMLHKGLSDLTTKSEEWRRPWMSQPKALAGYLERRAEQEAVTNELGRWPSNLILLGDEAARAVDGQSGFTQSGATRRSINGYESHASVPFLNGASNPGNQHGDEGGASRFFYRVADQIDEADPIFYTAKASREERDAGLERFPAKAKVFNGQSDRSAACAEGSVEDKFTTSPSRNIHPTVKPLSLTKYLAKLLLPPVEYRPRRILIPFSGSGSEMIGAMQAGWEEIIGIEAEPEYAEIAEARLRFWQQKHDTALFSGIQGGFQYGE